MGFVLVDPDMGLRMADFAAGERLFETYCRDPSGSSGSSRSVPAAAPPSIVV